MRLLIFRQVSSIYNCLTVKQMLKNYVLYFINTVKDVALPVEAQEPVFSKSFLLYI